MPVGGQALGVHQATQDEHREQPAVDVAATQHQADLAADGSVRDRHHRGEAGGAGALDHGLLDLEQGQDRGLERVLFDQENVGDQLAHDRQGELARRLTAMPSAIVGRSGASGRPRSACGTSRGSAAACTPTISTSGLSALAAIAMPEIRPPPPIGTTSTSSSGAAVQHLQRDGALARDHLPDRRTGWMKVRLRAAAKSGQARRLVHEIALEQHPGAELLVFSTFRNGVMRGITMVAGTPRRVA